MRLFMRITMNEDTFYEEDVYYDQESNYNIRDICNTLREIAEEDERQDEDGHADDSETTLKAPRQVKGAVNAFLILLGVFVMYSLTGILAYNITWSTLLALGFSNHIKLTAASLLVGFFTFITAVSKPLKWFAGSITTKQSLASAEQESIHNKLFQNNLLQKDKYTKIEQSFFSYEVKLAKVKTILKEILIKDIVPKVNDLSAQLDKIPEELAAQVWLAFLSRVTAHRSSARAQLLKNQTSVRAAIYDLIDKDKDNFIEFVFNITSKDKIMLEDINQMRDKVLSWLEEPENAEVVGRSGFNRQDFYQRSRSKRCVLYYQKIVAVHQVLRLVYFVRKHMDEAKDQMKADGQRGMTSISEKEVFKSLAKKMIRKLDWFQRSSMPHQSHTARKVNGSTLIFFCYGLLVQGGFMVAMSFSSLSRLYAASTNAAKIAISFAIAISGFCVSWFYTKKLAEKQIHRSKYYWELLSEDKLNVGMLSDFWFPGLKGIVRKVMAFTMAVTTSIFTYQFMQWALEQTSGDIALIKEVFFGYIAPWLQPIYIPVASLASFYVGIFFFARVLKFYFNEERQDRGWQLANIRREVLATVSIVKRPVSILATLAATLQAGICYVAMVPLSPNPYLSVSLVVTAFLALNAMNRNGYHSIQKSLHQLKSLYYPRGPQGIEDIFDHQITSCPTPGRTIKRSASSESLSRCFGINNGSHGQLGKGGSQSGRASPDRGMGVQPPLRKSKSFQNNRDGGTPTRGMFYGAGRLDFPDMREGEGDQDDRSHNTRRGWR